MNKIEIMGAKETLYVEHLDNGLDIFMVPKRTVQNFNITLNVKYGSINTNYKWNGKKYENPKGIAHYLEHLMFNMKEGDAFKYFATLGSYANAYTTNECTSYEVFSNSKFKENLSYLLKMVYTPYFTKELVNKERNIIIEEIKMYEDDPATLLFKNLSENLYINDERRYLISGTIQDVKKIKVEDIENAYKAFYRPENMFLVITGNFNPEEAVAITSEVMSGFGFADYEVPETIFASEPFEVNKDYFSQEMDINKAKVVMAYKVPVSNFKGLKLSKLELKLYLNLILKINFGNTSILNEEMKSNGIINKIIGYRIENAGEYFILNFIAETDYPDYFIKRIKDAMEKLTVNADSVKRKIKVVISNLIWIYDDIEAVNADIKDDIIKYGNVLSDIYQIYKTLNEDMALKVINKLNRKLLTVSIIKPKN